MASFAARNTAIRRNRYSRAPHDVRTACGWTTGDDDQPSGWSDVPPGMEEHGLMCEGARQGDVDAACRTFHLAADLQQFHTDGCRLAVRQRGALKAAAKVNEQHLRDRAQIKPHGVGVEQVA